MNQQVVELRFEPRHFDSSGWDIKHSIRCCPSLHPNARQDLVQSSEMAGIGQDHLKAEGG